MTRRYRLLLLATLVVGVVLGVLSRLPHRATAQPETPVATPLVALSLDVRDGSVTPEACAAPKGSRVRLSVTNRGSAPVHLGLAGYEDRLKLEVAPGQSQMAEFLADRPGDDFAWTMDGKPTGRFKVTGSHLVEGHR
jgi:hypothetical protein